MNNLPQSIPATKKEVLSLAQQKAAEIKETGGQDPLAVAVESKRIIDYLTELTSCLKPEILTEAVKYGKNSFTAHNAKFEVKEMGSRYDFTGCGHTKLDELYAKQKELTKDIKGIEDFLKTLKQGMTIVDEDSGDVITVRPPVKLSTTGCSISY